MQLPKKIQLSVFFILHKFHLAGINQELGLYYHLSEYWISEVYWDLQNVGTYYLANPSMNTWYCSEDQNFIQSARGPGPQ